MLVPPFNLYESFDGIPWETFMYHQWFCNKQSNVRWKLCFKNCFWIRKNMKVEFMNYSTKFMISVFICHFMTKLWKSDFYVLFLRILNVWSNIMNISLGFLEFIRVLLIVKSWKRKKWPTNKFFNKWWINMHDMYFDVDIIWWRN